MLKIAICDDEKLFLNLEEKMISNYMETCGLEHQIMAFTSGLDLLKALKEITKFDIIFLDIGMNELNGFETAKQIREITQDAYLVFVTVYVSYALQGYEVRATRFILKDNKLFRPAMKECMDSIIQEMNYIERRQSFHFKEGNIELAHGNIVYIESIGHKLYFRIVLNSSLITFSMYEKLDIIEGVLQDNNFCRIHQSYLVNLKYIKRIERYSLELRNGTYLNISQSRYKEVNNTYINYLGMI